MFIFGLIASVADREKVLARDIPRDCLQCLRTTPHRLIETRRNWRFQRQAGMKKRASWR